MSYHVFGITAAASKICKVKYKKVFLQTWFKKLNNDNIDFKYKLRSDQPTILKPDSEP